MDNSITLRETFGLAVTMATSRVFTNEEKSFGKDSRKFILSLAMKSAWAHVKKFKTSLSEALRKVWQSFNHIKLELACITKSRCSFLTCVYNLVKI